MTQRILITGGAGFIGSHTADLLLSQGHEVVVLDNLSSGQLNNLDLTHPNLVFIEGDVLEYPLLQDLLMDCDAVLHLAAVASVIKTIEEPIYSFQVNTQGHLHVLEAVQKADRPIRFVYASSAAVYGDASELPCRDDKTLSCAALSPYALQKRQNEDYAKLYKRLFAINSLGLRYFNVYGSRQDPDSPYSGVISRFLDAYQKENELTIFGDGQQSRDFIYIADVARANMLALQSEATGVLNIATGVPQTLLQMIEHMEKAGGKPAKYCFAPARPGDIKTSYAQVTMAEEQLNFAYSVSLGEGLQRLAGS